MAHAYTPGLKVTDYAIVERKRILPIKGEVMVEKGARVEPDTVIARTELPGDVFPVNIANLLGLGAKEVPAAMLKQIGETAEQGERRRRQRDHSPAAPPAVVTERATLQHPEGGAARCRQ